MIRRPPRSTLFPTRRSSDLVLPDLAVARPPHITRRRSGRARRRTGDRKSTRLNSSHGSISYAVFCLKKKKKTQQPYTAILEPTDKRTRVAQPHPGRETSSDH